MSSSKVTKKILDSEDDIVFQCLDNAPPLMLQVARKKASELHGTEAISKTVEKNSKGQYVIDGMIEPEVKTLMCEGIARASKKKGYNIVCLNTYTAEEAAALIAEATPKTADEKLQDQALELAEANESLDDAKAKIAELEQELLDKGTNKKDA